MFGKGGDAYNTEGGSALQELFNAKVDSGGWVATKDATTVLESWGPTSGAAAFTLEVKQQIVPTDGTGSYSITITFAGTVK